MRKSRFEKWLLLVGAAFIVFNSAGVTTAQAAPVYTPAEEVSLDTGSYIEKLQFDNERGYLYATASETNQLLFINPDTMRIEKSLSVGSHPGAMDQVGNKMYVALEGATLIAVVNLDTKQVEKTIVTQAQPMSVAVDGNGLFYTEDDSWGDIRRIDLTDGTDTVMADKVGRLALGIDRSRHVLYAGESLSSYRLHAFNSVTFEELWLMKPDIGSGYSSSLIVDQSGVYFGSTQVDPDRQRIVSTAVGGEVLDVDGAFIYTTSGVYTKNEGAQAASYAALPRGSDAEADGSGHVFSYSGINSRAIVKRTYKLDAAQKAVEVDRGADSMAFNHKLTGWVMGEGEKYLYAISAEANRLLQIDTATFTVKADRYVGSQPSDIDFRDGVLYISLKGSTHMVRIDTKRETDFMAPLDELEVGLPTLDIAAGASDIYYSIGGYGWLKVHAWRDDAAFPFKESVYEPSLTMGPDGNTLWIGETGTSGGDLYKVNVAAKQILDKTVEGYSYGNRELPLDGDMVYYAGRRFSTGDLGLIYGEYKEKYEYFAHLLFARGSTVIGTKAVYNRDTFNQALKLPFTIVYGYVKKDGSVLLYAEDDLTSKEGPNYILYRFDGLDSLKTAMDNRLRPQEGRFVDRNTAPQVIDGYVTFRPGVLDRFVDHYEIQLYDGSNRPVKLDFTETVYKSEQLPNGSYAHKLIAPMKIVPETVKKIGIVPVLKNTLDKQNEAVLFVPLADNRTSKNAFMDVRTDLFAKFAIETLADMKVVQGYKDGAFQPYGLVTRAEFATMLVKALRIPAAGGSYFKDVPRNAWYYEVISASAKAGLIKGYTDGTFHPNRTITQQETLEIVNNALLYGGYKQTSAGKGELLHFFDQSKGYDAWSKQAVHNLLREGIVKDYDTFQINADKKSNRAECAELIYRLLYVLNKV
ncbi:S-layer homology domain-containing protein [Paenibacillus montanisoli]|nr:S-layer homology domain-containing protein [Paenibacillus montanisoli]